MSPFLRFVARLAASGPLVVAAALVTAACGHGPPAPLGGAGGAGGTDPQGSGNAGAGGAGASAEDIRCDEDILSDPDHCGGCDRPCAPGQLCQLGRCVCEEIDDPPSFRHDIAPLLGGTACATGKCHDAVNAVMNLDLTMGGHAYLVDVPALECGSQRLRVAPGAPHESYLIDKLAGIRLCSGGPMPPSAPLEAPAILMISEWICAGAVDDAPTP